ncbi:MAG: GAF domain-containing protein [Bacteroidales bacterium]|nr:GAF domain-containing protein [Bacteroidales bacterium]MBN2812965.1 GAF domain-containing protein [Bacteroidales bacterium]
MSDIKNRKKARYQRVYNQLKLLVIKSENLTSRMATINAILYHKMDGFFWVGFYLLDDKKLQVGPYQGPVACLELPYQTGVCWEGIKTGQPVLVPDVHSFPGHIACDARSKSEVVIPCRNKAGLITGVLDIDSNLLGNFDESDVQELQKIVDLLNL